MDLFKDIYQLFPAPLKRYFWRLFMGMVVLALIETVTLGIIAYYAATISDPQSSFEHFVNYQLFGHATEAFFPDLTVRAMIALLSALLIGAVLAKNLSKAIVTLYITRFSASLERLLGALMLDKLLNRDYVWHLNQNSADLIQNVHWRREVGRKYGTFILKVMTEVVMLLVLLCGLLLVQPVVSLLFIVVQGFLGFIVYQFLRKKLRESAEGCRKTEMTLNRNVTASLQAVKDVKITGAQNYFLKKFDSWSRKFERLFSRQQVLNEAPLLVLETLGFCLLAGAILFMLFGLGYSPLETTATTALLAVTAWRTLPAFNRVVSSMAGLQTARPYVQSFLTTLAHRTDCSQSVETKDCLPSLSNKISFEDIDFSYEPHHLVLSSFNLEIKAGQSVGVVGPSGCGKSTFVDLLAGLLFPQAGRIEIDGIALTPSNALGWQQKIGYVSQTPYIFDGTLLENVAFGHPATLVDRNRIFEVCRMAAIDFIDQLPKGIDSFIGERGVKLSGGQRQRVAIARALYRDSDLIIFDEATSALDEHMDQEIRQLISRLKGSKTMVVISHRPSSVADCDFVLDLATPHSLPSNGRTFC